MVLQLRFARFPVELLTPVLSDIASALLDRPVELGEFPSQSFRGERRTRILESDGVVSTEDATRKMEPGRDGGWAYAVEWTLELSGAGGPMQLSFSATGWEPVPNGLGLRCEGVDAAAFRRIRERLCARLGADSDQTDDLWPALANIEAALAADELELARELFEGAERWPGTASDPLQARLEALRPQLELDDW